MTVKPDSSAQSLGLLSEAGPARDLWARAAVQERFTVESLLTDWFAAKDTVSADDEGAATTAALDLRELAVPALDAQGKDALRLAPGLRYQVLQSVGVEAARQALQAIPAQKVTSAETLFRDLLVGQQASSDKDDRQRLYQLATVADWAGAVGMPLDFDPQDLRQSMRQRDFIEGLGGPDLSRFVGRKRELGQLRQLWLGHHKSSIALIEAPGGMGKSLLISRFVSDILELPPSQVPNAVFHLDFDRRKLQTARPATIVTELVKQARQWAPSDRVRLLDDLGQQSSFSSGLESQGFARGSESYSDIGMLCRQLVDILRRDPQLAPRILVVVDSFEQVVGFDDTAADSPKSVCAQLVESGAEVMMILASRIFPGDWLKPYASNASTHIRLTTLSVRDATQYLEAESRRLGRPLTKTMVRHVLKGVGRSPLALRLAMSLLDKDGATANLSLWADGLRASPERIQAMLHDRILKRLRDRDLRKLAMPGLLVRRLTEGVIAEVLAGACGLDLATSPRELMNAAVREGQLFRREPSDPDALWHRSDVRALMLPDIDVAVPKQLAEDVNRAAVEYYSRADDTVSRTEELYHRLRLDQPAEVVRPRWTAKAGKLLRTALPELPTRARTFVRSSLGGASLQPLVQAEISVGSRQHHQQQGGIDDLRGVVRRQLQQGLFEEALRTLQQQAAGRFDGPLGDIYAETLVALGRHDELISGVQGLQAGLPTDNAAIKAGVESAAAGVLEGRGLLREALEHWEAAGGAAVGSSDDELMLLLSSHIGALRVSRKLLLSRTRPADRESACQLAFLLQRQLLERAVILRETFAELSELLLEPTTPHRSFLQNLFAGLLRLREAFPCARGDGERAKQIGIELFGQSFQDVDQLNAHAEKLAYGPPSELPRLIKVLREEVDRTLERAAGRGSQQTPATAWASLSRTVAFGSRGLLSRGKSMAQRNVEELKAYLETITSKHGGLDWLTSEASTIAGPQVEAPAMALTSGGLEGARVAPTRNDAMEGLKKLSLGQEPSAIEMAGMEAIILPDLRPAMTIENGNFTVTHPLWVPIFTPEVRTRMRQAIPSIGRIEMPGNTQYPYGGTGFVVGKGLVMTNRHVAEIFARGIGDRHVGFIPGAAASINFGRENNGDDGINFRVRRIVMIHPYWDMALLAVDSDGALPPPLKLSLHDARDLSDRDIAVVGYPAFDSRNPTDVQNKVMNGLYNVKRLQPGELKGGKATASFGKVLKAATHDCSTLGGNSGSALVDLTTGEVLALHFGGEYKRRNYAVPSAALGHDSRVVDAGVQFAGTAPGGANEWQGWWNEADGSEANAGGGDGEDGGNRDDDAPTGATGGGRHPPVPSAQGGMAAGGSVTFELPLRITVSLGTEPVATVRSTETSEMAGLEALKEPDHDKNYSTRKGYSDDFLNSKNLDPLDAVPMPDAADAKVLAVTKAGSTVLHYQNFSLRMHASRRLALVTASNVTKEKKLRKPESSGDYTRRGLSGLGKNDQEKWFLDDRLEARYQLPDVFFTKDRTAFDKGHIVRRDDVAWGSSYAALRRANGDTYHVTNCSPQVAGFNRSTLGKDNWGDLENLVLSEAANERLCVFAGPVLRNNDTIFVGNGDGGTTLRARIPSQYWKVVVARNEGELAAYGFVLDQDLSEVQFTEFAVPTNFVKTMRSIGEIAEMTGVKFDKVIVDADQHDTVRGEELAARASIERK